jgi:hypothetical protein
VIGRQFDIEGAALAYLTFHPDQAIMNRNYSLAIAKPIPLLVARSVSFLCILGSRLRRDGSIRKSSSWIFINS